MQIQEQGNPGHFSICKKLLKSKSKPAEKGKSRKLSPIQSTYDKWLFRGLLAVTVGGVINFHGLLLGQWIRAVSTQESHVLRQPPGGASNLISLKMKPDRVMNGIGHKFPQGSGFNHTRIPLWSCIGKWEGTNFLCACRCFGSYSSLAQKSQNSDNTGLHQAGWVARPFWGAGKDGSELEKTTYLSNSL